MSQVRYDCDCDRVIEMEDMAIGVEEILQYARAVLPRDSVRSLIRGLEEILSISPAIGEESSSSAHRSA